MVFSKDPLTERLWAAFRAKLPSLFAESSVARPPGPRWPHRPVAEVPRGRAGAQGGWLESTTDAETPWLPEPQRIGFETSLFEPF